jgi:hypothetical protein
MAVDGNPDMGVQTCGGHRHCFRYLLEPTPWEGINITHYQNFQIVTRAMLRVGLPQTLNPKPYTLHPTM